MKRVKYGLEVTFPDEDIADVNLIQRVLSEAPEFEDCLVNVYIGTPKNEASKEMIDIEGLTKGAKPCPSCRGREIHVFYIDKEILLDMDLPKEYDTFETNFCVFMCRKCNHYYQ